MWRRTASPLLRDHRDRCRSTAAPRSTRGSYPSDRCSTSPLTGRSAADGCAPLTWAERSSADTSTSTGLLRPFPAAANTFPASAYSSCHRRPRNVDCLASCHVAFLLLPAAFDFNEGALRTQRLLRCRAEVALRRARLFESRDGADRRAVALHLTDTRRRRVRALLDERSRALQLLPPAEHE